MDGIGRWTRIAAVLPGIAIGLRLGLAQAQTNEPSGVFHGVGIVKAIDPSSGALTLDHEEIKGLMPAMEMMYRVKSPAASLGLRPGDKIDFSLDAKSYTILVIKVIARGK
jgi:Cu/Ag efflux protein CusF